MIFNLGPPPRYFSTTNIIMKGMKQARNKEIIYNMVTSERLKVLMSGVECDWSLVFLFIPRI